MTNNTITIVFLSVIVLPFICGTVILIYCGMRYYSNCWYLQKKRQLSRRRERERKMKLAKELVRRDRKGTDKQATQGDWQERGDQQEKANSSTIGFSETQRREGLLGNTDRESNEVCNQVYADGTSVTNADIRTATNTTYLTIASRLEPGSNTDDKVALKRKLKDTCTSQHPQGKSERDGENDKAMDDNSSTAIALKNDGKDDMTVQVVVQVHECSHDYEPINESIIVQPCIAYANTGKSSLLNVEQEKLKCVNIKQTLSSTSNQDCTVVANGSHSNSVSDSDYMNTVPEYDYTYAYVNNTPSIQQACTTRTVESSESQQLQESTATESEHTRIKTTANVAYFTSVSRREVGSVNDGGDIIVLRHGQNVAGYRPSTRGEVREKQVSREKPVFVINQQSHIESKNDSTPNHAITPRKQSARSDNTTSTTCTYDEQGHLYSDC